MMSISLAVVTVKPKASPIVKQLINGKKLSTSELESVSVQFNSGDIDNAYLRFDNNGTNGGQSDLYIAEIDLYKGTQKGRGNQHLKIKNI